MFTSSYDRGIECCSEEFDAYQKVNKSTPLISGFLTAIRSFARELGGKLEQLNLGKWDLYFYEEGEITCVILTQPTENGDLISLYKIKVKEIAKLFNHEYRMDYAKWDGSINYFRNFEQLMNYNNLLDGERIKKSLCKSCIADAIQFMNT